MPRSARRRMTRRRPVVRSESRYDEPLRPRGRGWRRPSRPWPSFVLRRRCSDGRRRAGLVGRPAGPGRTTSTRATSTPARSWPTAPCAAGARASRAVSATATSRTSSAAAAAAPVNIGPGRSAARDRGRRLPHLRDPRRRLGALLGLRRQRPPGLRRARPTCSRPPPPRRSTSAPGRTATAITAGASHTCVILDDGAVRCWGNGVSGRLGYGNQRSIGDDETPAAVGHGRHRRRAHRRRHLGRRLPHLRDPRRRAAGLLGLRLGRPARLRRHRPTSATTRRPAAAGPVNLGRPPRARRRRAARATPAPSSTTARRAAGASAPTAGSATAAPPRSRAPPPPPRSTLGPGPHGDRDRGRARPTRCAILDTGAIRCWGFGGNGRLGYGATDSIGDDPGETPASVAPVDLGAGPHRPRPHRRLLAHLRPPRRRHRALLGLRRQRPARLRQREQRRRQPRAQRPAGRAGPAGRRGRARPSPTSRSACRQRGRRCPSAARSRSPSRVVNRGPGHHRRGRRGAAAARRAGLPRRRRPPRAASPGATGLWSVGALPPGGVGGPHGVGDRGLAGHAHRRRGGRILDRPRPDLHAGQRRGRGRPGRRDPGGARPSPRPGPTARRLPRKLGVKVVRVPKRGVAKRLVVTGRADAPAPARPVCAAPGRSGCGRWSAGAPSPPRPSRCARAAAPAPTRAPCARRGPDRRRSSRCRRPSSAPR